MDPDSEFFRDMLKAFEDLPPEYFSEFRQEAANRGISTVELGWIVYEEFMRKGRGRKE
jgi:hypothetical protein